MSPTRNHFPLVPASGRSVLLAGGIGVTPLLAMAEQLHALGSDFELHYCTRTPQRAAFLTRRRHAPYSACVSHHVDSGPAEQHLDLAAVLAQAGPRAQLYVCGPQPFLDFVRSTAATTGFFGAIHSGSFSPVRAAGEQDTAFEVELAKSGAVYTVAPGQSLLSVLLAHRVDLSSSCKQGICGACLTGVRSGIPDHRGQYLTDDEHARNDQMTPCCSRAKRASRARPMT